MLRWARERAGYSLPDVAAHMKRPQAELAGWESGKDHPTFPQARKLAELYKRTLSVFYLAEPPTEADLPPDYRRSRTGAPAPDLSPRIRSQVRQLHALREAALELADEDPGAFPPFPVRVTLNDVPAQVGERLRDALQVDVQTQRGWGGPEKSWSQWRIAVERVGCLVFVLDRIDAEEFDGFSLAFDRAPVIAINGNRALSSGRRVFTLLHELAHIALRSEGVCNLVDRADRAEAFCNQTAAAVLMPATPFRQAATALAPAALATSRRGAWSDAELRQLADTFGASLQAVYVRLVALDLADQTQYEAWWRARERDRVAVPRHPEGEPREEGGPSFYNLYLHRMSFSYLRTVFASYHDERLSLSELSDHLGVRPSTALALDEHFLKRLRGRAS
jgi:Zn-dependent peptidase ImmA (M78 family)/transcriptional regulator with XRE-family HTH domain